MLLLNLDLRVGGNGIKIDFHSSEKQLSIQQFDVKQATVNASRWLSSVIAYYSAQSAAEKLQLLITIEQSESVVNLKIINV